MLQNNEGTVAEIAFRVGFGSPAYFNKCFHEYFGYPPGKAKHFSRESNDEKESVRNNNQKKNKTGSEASVKLTTGIVSAFIILIIILLVVFKTSRGNILKELRSSDEKLSVAVMPFLNMTNDTIWDIWQNGIQNEVINSLTNSEELRVRQTESINSLIQSKGISNYASITPSAAMTISQKLKADIFRLWQYKTDKVIHYA